MSHLGALLALLALASPARSQTVRTENGALIFEVSGGSYRTDRTTDQAATLTLSTAVPSAATRLLDSSTTFQPQVKSFPSICCMILYDG